MSKSSLKTFLAGKNPYSPGPNPLKPKFDACLKNSQMLDRAVDPAEGWIDSEFNIRNIDTWNIDVLDDGTAITYCADT